VDKKVNDDDVAGAGAADDDEGLNCIYYHNGHLTLWF